MVSNIGARVKWNSQQNYFHAVDGVLMGLAGRPLNADQKNSCIHHGLVSHGPRPFPSDIYIDPIPTAVERRRFTNTWSTGQGTAGAFSIPESFIAGWQQGQSARAVLRPFITIHKIADGRDHVLAAISDSTTEAVITPPNTSTTATADVSFGKYVFRPRKFMTGASGVPVELTEDGENFLFQLGVNLGTQVARGIDKKMILGTGAGEPQGLIAGAATVSTFTSGTVVVDDLLSLINGVDPYFQNPARSRFVINGAMWWNTIHKLKEGAGGYLIRVSDTGLSFCGFPVLLDDHVSGTVSTGQTICYFGDLSRVHLAETGIRLQMLRETLADKDQVLVRASQRADSLIVAAGDVPLAKLTVS